MVTFIATRKETAKGSLYRAHGDLAALGLRDVQMPGSQASEIPGTGCPRLQRPGKGQRFKFWASGSVAVEGLSWSEFRFQFIYFFELDLKLKIILSS